MMAMFQESRAVKSLSGDPAKSISMKLIRPTASASIKRGRDRIA